MTLRQEGRLLYVLRNVAGRATRKAVTGAKPLALDLLEHNGKTISPAFWMEDTTRSGHTSTELQELYRDYLPKILAGNDPRWKLWEVEFYTDRFVLHFVDMLKPVTKTARNTDLSCFAFWEPDTDLIVSAPPQPKEPAAFFHWWFEAVDAVKSDLHVVYPVRSHTEIAPFLSYEEVYGVRIGK